MDKSKVFGFPLDYDVRFIGKVIPVFERSYPYGFGSHESYREFIDHHNEGVVNIKKAPKGFENITGEMQLDDFIKMTDDMLSVSMRNMDVIKQKQLLSVIRKTAPEYLDLPQNEKDYMRLYGEWSDALSYMDVIEDEYKAKYLAEGRDVPDLIDYTEDYDFRSMYPQYLDARDDAIYLENQIYDLHIPEERLDELYYMRSDLILSGVTDFYLANKVSHSIDEIETAKVYPLDKVAANYADGVEQRGLKIRTYSNLLNTPSRQSKDLDGIEY